MSFKRLETDDFVISADSITAGIWTGNAPTLTQFFTSSVQAAGSTGTYYLSVYQTASTDSAAEVQFDIAYGNKQGSGSTLYNTAVAGKSPTQTVYGQYRTLVLGDENTDFVFGSQTVSDFWAISVSRNRYKESLLPGSLTLELSGSLGVILLTDDSQYVPSITFKDAGRVFNLISGSAGVKTTSTANNTTDGWSEASGSYGWLLPDIGTILLNPTALSGSVTAGGVGLNVGRNSNTNDTNNAKLYNAINGATARVFTLNSQETITSDFVFIRPRSSEFNYSENPSYISGSTGEVVFDSFINNPQTYITTVGLYNDTNDLLAVAKLSRPLKKDFTKEALVRVKLDF
jgi:hypothetical protein